MKLSVQVGFLAADHLRRLAATPISAKLISKGERHPQVSAIYSEEYSDRGQ